MELINQPHLLCFTAEMSPEKEILSPACKESLEGGPHTTRTAKRVYINESTPVLNVSAHVSKPSSGGLPQRLLLVCGKAMTSAGHLLLS